MNTTIRTRPEPHNVIPASRCLVIINHMSYASAGACSSAVAAAASSAAFCASASAWAAATAAFFSATFFAIVSLTFFSASSSFTLASFFAFSSFSRIVSKPFCLSAFQASNLFCAVASSKAPFLTPPRRCFIR